MLRTNLSEIRNTGRAAQGVTIFKPQPGDAVASIACIRDLSELEEAAASASTNGKTNDRVPKDPCSIVPAARGSGSELFRLREI